MLKSSLLLTMIVSFWLTGVNAQGGGTQGATGGANQSKGTGSSSQQDKSGSTGQQKGGASQRYDDNDSVASAYTPTKLTCISAPCATLADGAVNRYPGVLKDSGLDFRGLLEPYSDFGLNWPTDGTACQDLSKRAVIVHIALWRVDSEKKVIKSLAYSTWRGYRAYWDGRLNRCSIKQPRSPDNSPSFFKAKQGKLIAIDLLQSEVAAKDLSIVYKVSTTPTVPQNLQDLGTLIEAITGATAAGRAEKPKPPALSGFVTIADIDTTSAPPYSINIEVSAGKASKDDTGKGADTSSTTAKSPANSVDCTDVATKGCSYSRQFTVTEAESWDVSVGLTIPGVTEAVYSTPTTGSLPQSKPVHHTDVYVLVDLYPFGYHAPKDSYWPHVNFGVPVTGQSLHRPYFGLGEDISGWARRKGFPLAIGIFGGLVDMKQQVYSSSSKQLKWDRALKGVFGIEMPVGQLVSKLGKSKSNSGSSSSSKSSTGQ